MTQGVQGQPLICLNMIVRDESAVIGRCIRSVLPWIDHWVIVDTGSVDDTARIIGNALAHLPGTLHHRPWHNFGHNRNEALALAQEFLHRQAPGQPALLLFIDADEQLITDAAWTGWPALKGPAYSLSTHFGELRYDRLSLISTALPWRWQGVLHEYLDAGAPVDQPRVEGIGILVTPDGARSQDPHKFLKDVAVLEQALRDEPGNTRYQFYLAQSWRDAGYPEKALECYAVRASMGGWEEEVWYALYQCALLAERLGQDPRHISAAYLRAYEFRPQRAEALTALATWLRQQQHWHQAYLFASAAVELPFSGDRLFVDATCYQWRATDEKAVAAWYTGRRDEARTLWQALLANPHLPADQVPRIARNLQL